MENRAIFSAEITEIIGTTPRWILRAGGGLLLGLLLGLVALAGTVRVPETAQAPLLIRGVVPPYYLVQTDRPWQPLLASGQRVTAGQALAAGSPEPLRAPFAGTLYYAAAPGAALAAGDTLGMVVPARNAFRFSGKLETSRLAELRQAPGLRLLVSLDPHAERHLTLRGRLGYVDPVARHGQVSYVGQLDSASSALLTQHLPAITNLEGQLLLDHATPTILHRLLH